MADDNKENNDYVYERKESFFETFKNRLTQLRIAPPGGVKTTNRSMESLMNSGSISGFFRKLFDNAQKFFAAKPDKNPNKFEKVSVSDFAKNETTPDLTKTQDPEKPQVIIPGKDKSHSQTVAFQEVPAVADIIVDENAQTIIMAESENTIESADTPDLSNINEEYQSDLDEIDAIDAALRKMEAERTAAENNTVQKNIVPKGVGTVKKQNPSQEGPDR